MRIGRYETHPASELFPLMPERELEDLARDIRDHGLRTPVVLCGGRVLDGRNRLLACERARVAPRFEDLATEESAIHWMVSMNLHRRHLDPSQRAMIAARLLHVFEGEARERQGRRTDLGLRMRDGETGKASEKAAGAVGVSPRTVEHAAAVLRHGTPALVAAVERGTMTVSAAAALARAAPAFRPDGTAAARRVLKTALSAPRLRPAPRRGSFALICAWPRWDDREELDRYRRLKFDAMAAENATAVLYSTSAALPDAVHMLLRWGLDYAASVVCTRPDRHETPFVRERHDLILFGRRGQNPPVPPAAERVDSTIELGSADRDARRAAFLAKLERMFPGTPKAEVFSPSPRQGWASVP